MLGSAIVVLDIDDEGERKRIVFTGDLGRKNMPILRDPEVPDGADVLIMREHVRRSPARADRRRWSDELGEVVERTFQRGGKVIIPSFALERAQEVVYALKQLRSAGASRRCRSTSTRRSR